MRAPCIVHPGAFWLPGAFLYFLVKRGTVLERASKISMKERTRISAGKTLRCGYTTGTCAAAAAGAAARMALTGTVCTQSAVCLPDGETVTFTVEEPKAGKGDASCAVRKDAGDDIDVTDKMLVFARVTLTQEDGVAICGGKGVGRVTKPGLDQPVGEAAINRVPRMMIARTVEAVLQQARSELGARVEIFIPDGEKLAQRTYNPRLGIEGGLSILGTTGIVEPMSEAALVDTIRTELRMLRAGGDGPILVTPGNYGETFSRDSLGLKTKRSVLCSNFLGETLDYMTALGFGSFLFVGHIGKLVKVAGGIFQTHSRVADARMEILAAHAALAGADSGVIHTLMGCATTDAALDVLERNGILTAVLESLLQKIVEHIRFRVGETPFGVVLFSNGRGVLGTTEKADEIMNALNRDGQKAREE